MSLARKIRRQNKGIFNLPTEPKKLAALLRRSEKSFAGLYKEKEENHYFFVLEDLKRKKIIGTSMLAAQHGSKSSPHVFFKIKTRLRKSKTLKITRTEKVLELGFDSKGVSELCALSLDPDYRGHPLKLGKLLSYIRFLYVAAHKNRFQKKMIAELAPQYSIDGQHSHLWEALGKKFTGLDYTIADRISMTNKEFIKSLFPKGDIHIDLLPPEAQACIGQVGRQTIPVQRMLEKISFSYSKMVDPFDGGPHYSSLVEKIKPVKQSKKIKEINFVERFVKTPRKGFLFFEKNKQNILTIQLMADYNKKQAVLNLDPFGCEVLEKLKIDSFEEAIWLGA